ncbi:CENP-Q, a CENPA-CAD centromere complex subunit-domain-containing protein [Xylaria sp. FL0043]|nr:CENP-Q, a CENPA-CAD centromere complex subunit-domain-containing protein [Xylaria sp. FL0043]
MDQPPAANQKRKRGRRANALRDNGAEDASSSAAPTASQHSQPEVNGEAEDGAMAKGSRRFGRRGRRVKGEASQQPQAESSPTQRSRHQSSTLEVEGNSAQQTNGTTPEGMKTTRRGRPRKGSQPIKPMEPELGEADDENENEGDSSLLRRSKRRRRSSDEVDENHPVEEEQGEDGAAVTEQVTKKRKRSGRPKNKEQATEEADPDIEAEATGRAQKRKTKRIRPSPGAQELEVDAESRLEPVQRRKKQGGPSKSGGGGRSSETGSQNKSSQRQVESADNEPREESTQGGSGTARRKTKPRRRSSEGQDHSPNRSSSPASVSSPPYRHIAQRTRRVTHNVIESKWSSLDPSSLTNIASLLHSVSLPTLTHVVPKQYAHAEDVLEKVIKGLRKRSARLPFPLASALPRREDELDFERTQSAVEVLLSQLDPLQHSVELLKREKERAEKDLEREYKVLDQLSTNARAEARERRNRLKKVHVLVPETTDDPVANKIDLTNADKAANQVFTGIQDEEMLTLAGQINNHMESMRGNLQQIDGVLPAIAKSHALLRTAIQPQFNQKQIENIMLGQVGP